ncbi:MAG: addiction module protein, partial [Bacteroidota bacterium]
KKQEQEHVSADELSAAWKTELLRRREEVKNGTTQLFTLQEVQDELNKEFGFDLTISHQS